MSILGSTVVWDRVHHIPLALHCIYGRSDEGGENGDGEEGREIPGEGNRVEIAWTLVRRWLGFVW